MAASFNRSSLKDQVIIPTKLDHPQISIQLFAKNLLEKVEYHALIGSKLSKHEVQSTLIFKIQMKLQNTNFYKLA